MRIVAIGGGEIGRPNKDGGRYPIETRAIDKEIIKLTGKVHPVALLLPTASGDSDTYYPTFERYYGKMLGCKTDVLYLIKGKLSKQEIERRINQADIIYVGGGNTLRMLKVWRNNLKGIQFKDKNGNILFGAVDNILMKGKKLIVLDYKTRGFALKDDTADHYQNQLNIYNFLLRKNGYETEDYAFLLFYVPKEILPKGEILFDTHLVKRKIDVKHAEKLFEKAIELLNGDCPTKTCEWCEKV